MKHPAETHFDLIAQNYDDYKDKNSLYYTTLINAIKKIVDGTNVRILDIGCGTGTVLAKLNPLSGMGIDISDQMIIRAREKYKNLKTLIFKKHNIEKNKINGRFDYIIFSDVIEHLVDPKKAIKNISLTMSAKTLLILTMANPYWEPAMWILEKLKLKMPEGPHRRISESELISILQNNKLLLIKKNTYFPSIPIPYVKDFGLIYIYEIKKNSNR